MASNVFESPFFSGGTTNAICAHIDRNSAQSAPTVTLTKILFNNAVTDTDDIYDGANSRAKPTTAGYYLVQLQVEVDANTGALLVCYIKKNGTTLVEGRSNASRTSDGFDSDVSVIVHMNGSSDYLEGYLYHNTGATESLVAARNYMNISYLGD